VVNLFSMFSVHSVVKRTGVDDPDYSAAFSAHQPKVLPQGRMVPLPEFHYRKERIDHMDRSSALFAFPAVNFFSVPSSASVFSVTWSSFLFP
jgi:hypothetical protein